MLFYSYAYKAPHHKQYLLTPTPPVTVPSKTAFGQLFPNCENVIQLI